MTKPEDPPAAEDADPRWGIVMFNDDVSPMDAVVSLLVETLRHDEPAAIELMLRVHQNGHAVIATGDRAKIAALMVELRSAAADRAPALTFREIERPDAVPAVSASPPPAQMSARASALAWTAIIAAAATVTWLTLP
ncbi:MAG: ATP-dependent Clp protease adaptor ClpS [Pseudomonadota bacterium]